MEKIMIMKGVSPLPLSVIGLLLFLLALITLLFLYSREERKPSFYPSFDLMKVRPIERVLRARPFQFTLQLPMVLIFLLIVVTGLYGNQNPGRNFATVGTWTIWWAGIIFLILFLGASWCLICPWSAIGDWVERVSFWKKKEGISLRKRWPRLLRNRYPAIVFFAIITWLELGGFITYSPRYTAYLAIVMLLLTILTLFIYERKVFCRYICFVGGIVGIYSNLAPVEVRSRDKGTCKDCRTKDCIWGNEKGYGCPIFEYPGGMAKNTNCILCTECLKTCPYDNMSLRIRPPLIDLSRVQGRLDEAILVLILLGLTLFHGVTMLPQWFLWAIKTIKEGSYYLYIGAFTLFELIFIALPIGLHYIAVRLGLSFSKTLSSREAFIQASYSLLPIAITYHLAHNLGHLNGEGTKALPVLSDPFGWGWDIFGTAGISPFTIIGTEGLKTIQLIIVAGGLVASLFLLWRIFERYSIDKRERLYIIVPSSLLMAIYSFFNAYLLIQPMVMRTVSYF